MGEKIRQTGGAVDQNTPMNDIIEGANNWASETHLAASRKFNEVWWLLDGIERQGGSAKLGTNTTDEPDHMATDSKGDEWYIETKMVSGAFRQLNAELNSAYYQFFKRLNWQSRKRRINITISQEFMDKCTAEGEDPMDTDDQLFSKRKDKVDSQLSKWGKNHPPRVNGGIHDLWVFYPDGETKSIPLV